jgi:AcrR family transcriptional regulator
LAQKNEKDEDLRVRRTRKALQTALIELTVERGFADITVRDIAERAMVNRATFYRHYLDKFDLLKQYMEDIYQMLGSSEKPETPAEKPATGSDIPSGQVVKMFQQIQDHADFFRLMLGPKGDPQFVQQVSQYIEKRMCAMLHDTAVSTPPGALPLDLTLRYVASAGIGAILWWLENDTPVSPEQMAAWVVQYSNADLRLSISTGPE